MRSTRIWSAVLSPSGPARLRRAWLRRPGKERESQEGFCALREPLASPLPPREPELLYSVTRLPNPDPRAPVGEWTSGRHLPLLRPSLLRVWASIFFPTFPAAFVPRPPENRWPPQAREGSGLRSTWRADVQSSPGDPPKRRQGLQGTQMRSATSHFSKCERF